MHYLTIDYCWLYGYVDVVVVVVVLLCACVCLPIGPNSRRFLVANDECSVSRLECLFMDAVLIFCSYDYYMRHIRNIYLNECV